MNYKTNHRSLLIVFVGGWRPRFCALQQILVYIPFQLLEEKYRSESQPF